jgi:3-(3-hydroxy-phenyl)propionate hydroxylase
MDADCDVLIIGCGPTGLVLSTLLAGLGVRVTVLERDADVYPTPRATHIDEETLRNFQATGAMAKLEVHTAPFGRVDIVDEDGASLLADEVGDPAAPHGYLGSRFFDQAAFERVLRAELGRHAHARLVTGVEAAALEDDGAAVTVRVKDVATGATSHLRAPWVVGCDGGRSFVREAIGAEMELVAPKRHWLIVDTLLRDPADADKLPGNFRYVLDPARLTIYAHGFGRNRRWEFQLGDDGAAPDEATLRGWLARYVDPERVDIVRVAPYAHRSLVARRWRAGRVLLAGDAAHMMPPSAGQGMCSGVRDAVNLAWKLQRVVTGGAGAALLDTYERERSRHVCEILEGTLAIGTRLEAQGAFARWRRRVELKLIANLPTALQGVIRQHMIRRPTLVGGLLDGVSALHGVHLPQVEAWRDGARCPSDDLLGYRFALVSLAPVGPRELQRAVALEVAPWRLGADLAEVDGALARWMRERDVEFALVRPDRVVFSAGRLDDLPRALGALERGLVAGDRLTPVP